MNIHQEREELRQKLEGLNELGALMERVQAHAKYISTIPVDERSNLQKIWILAYEATELKMAPGTEETLYEAAANLQTLDNLRQQTTIESSSTYKDRPLNGPGERDRSLDRAKRDRPPTLSERLSAWAAVWLGELQQRNYDQQVYDASRRRAPLSVRQFMPQARVSWWRRWFR